MAPRSRRGQVFQRAAERADRRAAGAEDDGRIHSACPELLRNVPTYVARRCRSRAGRRDAPRRPSCPRRLPRSTSPCGVTSITASSVTIRSTTFVPVSGSVQRVRILCPPSLRRVLHRDDHALGAGDQIHRAAHALDHLAGNHPVGEVAFLVDLSAPSTVTSMCPPRTIANESALLKYAAARAAR